MHYCTVSTFCDRETLHWKQSKKVKHLIVDIWYCPGERVVPAKIREVAPTLTQGGPQSQSHMFAHTTAHSFIRDSLPLWKNENLLHVSKAKSSPRDLQTCVMIWRKKNIFHEGVFSHLSKTNSQAEWFSLKGDPRLLIVKCKRRSLVGRCVRQCAPLKTLSASMSFSCIPCLALRFKLPPSAILISQQMHHLKWWQGIFWICSHTRHPSCHCRLGCRVSLLATTCFCTELPRSKVSSRTERRGDTRINVLPLQRSQQLRLPHSHFDTLVRLVSQPVDSVHWLSPTQIQVVWAVRCIKLQNYVQLQKLIHPHPLLFFCLSNNEHWADIT